MGDGLRLNNDQRTSRAMNVGLSFGSSFAEGDYSPKSDFHFRSEPSRSGGSVVLNHKPIGGLPQFNRFSPAFNSNNGFQASGGYGSGSGSGSYEYEFGAAEWALVIGGVALLGLLAYGLVSMNKCDSNHPCTSSSNRPDKF